MSTVTELACLGGVLAAVFLASHWPGLAVPSRPRDELDPVQGLRGFLAMGVFLQHALIWRHFTQHEGWYEARYFEQFGESRVILFFMLTAFLFYGRLVDARRGERPFDWLRLGVSRVLRLAPAYWLAMVLMLGVLAVAFRLHVDGAGTSIHAVAAGELVSQILAWMGFTLRGTPSIAGYPNTWAITAGVTWTLPFEIVFYSLLPLLALPLRLKVPLGATFVALIAAAWVTTWVPDFRIFRPFVGGMAAAVLVRLPGVAARLQGRLPAMLVLAIMLATIALFEMDYDAAPIALLSLTVAIVGSGNDLFGLLRWRVAHRLGDMAYSIYLLHGIGLYVMFLFVLGEQRSAALSPAMFALAVAVVVVAVLAVASLTRRWIERPPMRLVSAVTAWLRGAATQGGRWVRALGPRLVGRMAR